DGIVWRIACPYGQPGERLWVRETFQFLPEVEGLPAGYVYAADLDAAGQCPLYDAERRARHESRLLRTPKGPWTPSILMPRAASRLTLEVTEVRVERLQAIAYSDIRAEGIEYHPVPNQIVEDGGSSREAFAAVWDEINGKRPGCGWASNPWVWVVSFKTHLP